MEQGEERGLNPEDFKKFIDTETKLIEISKWIAGEKMGRDPGEDYIVHWINDHAKELRNAWNNSKCKTCKKDCPYNLRIFCENYEEEHPNNI